MSPRRALADEPGERHADWSEAMLQHDAEFDAGIVGDSDKLLGAFQADLERLFEEHVLAGGGGPPDEFEMRVGRRQQQHRIDRRIGKDGLDAVDDTESPWPRRKPFGASRLD